METAGKLVEDETLRDALKENGIGRPSTRAAIIETLFKRNYIRKERKNLIPTATGIELIDTIQDELIKSAELTGIWENKLRRIEQGKYDAQTFLQELKEMVVQITHRVKTDTQQRSITVEDTVPQKEIKPRAPRASKRQQFPHSPKEKQPVCPLCGQGSIIKGKSAYGCSRWKEGCTFRLPFDECGNISTTDELKKIIAQKYPTHDQPEQ